MEPAREVAVIGGGPAGGAAALQLARAGLPVTLYVPQRRGEKPCGGGLPEFLLPRLESFDPGPLAAVAVRSVLCENAAGRRVRLASSGLRIFRRGDLDPALAAAAVEAGARLVPAKVERVEWAGGRPAVVAGGEARACDWLIAADGARSLTRRCLARELGRDLAPAEESVGLGASVEGVEHPEMVLGFPGVADAYGWIFPRPGGVSVGIAYSPHRLSDGAAGGLLAAFLARHLHAAGGALRPRYRYPIPVYGPWTAPLVEAALAHRVLLTGDAAALADPLTREGIRPAALSGLWAAEALIAGRPRDYPRRLATELEGEMVHARRLGEIFFDGSLAQGMVSLCRFHPRLRALLRDLLSCRQPYRGLRRRLLRAAVGF